MTCRRFLVYCLYVITYAKYAPVGSVTKFFVVSMAHSDSSVLGAWFSAVRNTKQDSATRYEHYVTDKDTKKANAYVALGKNKMYFPADVGELSTGKFVGPSELIKLISSCLDEKRE